MVNLYKMGQEILKAKEKYRQSNVNKFDYELQEISILEMEEVYIETCKLFNDYDPDDPVLSWG